MDVRIALAIEEVCWSADRQVLVDASDPLASPTAINIATAELLARRGNEEGYTAADVASLVRDYLDGNTAGYLALVG
jgi:hypothetical protein